MTTALGVVPAADHNQFGHPEHPGRIAAVAQELESSGLLGDLLLIDPVAASQEQLRRVHSPALIEQVRLASSYGGGLLDADTYTTAASYHQAKLAAGTTCALSDLIIAKKVDNGFSLIRPPGHHAEKTRVGGFCLFNNVAVAAKHLQFRHGLDRVAIVDFDVHHGNGTQEIFYDDPSILFISIHLYQSFFYPGTGSLDEIGNGNGMGTNVNIPLPSGCGDNTYRLVLQKIIEPRIKRFRPQMLLISAGFDAHWRDPLASMALSLTGYAEIIHSLLSIAKSECNGKALFVLEGGYQLRVLAYGVLNLINTLLERDELVDPLGNANFGEPDITFLLRQMRHKHLPS